MGDDRLRALERTWRTTGTVEDEAAYLAERLRLGRLTRRRVAIAAELGHPAARTLEPVAASPPEPELVLTRVDLPEAVRRDVCCTWAERHLASHAARLPADEEATLVEALAVARRFGRGQAPLDELARAHDQVGDLVRAGPRASALDPGPFHAVVLVGFVVAPPSTWDPSRILRRAYQSAWYAPGGRSVASVERERERLRRLLIERLLQDDA